MIGKEKIRIPMDIFKDRISKMNDNLAKLE